MKKVLEETVYALIDWIISNPQGSEEEAAAHILSLEPSWEAEEVSGFFDGLAAELIKVQWVTEPKWDAIRDKVVTAGEEADKTLTDLLVTSSVLTSYDAIKTMICKSQLVEQQDSLEATELSITTVTAQIDAGEAQIVSEQDEDVKAVLQAGVDSLKSELSRFEAQKAVTENLISTLDC